MRVVLASHFEGGKKAKKRNPDEQSHHGILLLGVQKTILPKKNKKNRNDISDDGRFKESRRSEKQQASPKGAINAYTAMPRVRGLKICLHQLPI